MYGRSLFALAVVGTIAGHCAAAPQIIFGIDPRNTVPGVVANGILADGGGTDWQAGNLLIELTTGFVYNGVPDTHLPQQGFWGIIPDLQFDTWVGVPGDLTNNVHNFADEFDSGPLSMSGQKISVA